MWGLRWSRGVCFGQWPILSNGFCFDRILKGLKQTPLDRTRPHTGSNAWEQRYMTDHSKRISAEVAQLRKTMPVTPSLVTWCCCSVTVASG
jgi:hypothetical protein